MRRLVTCLSLSNQYKGKTMEIIIALEQDNGLESKISTIFGRCPFFMVIDPQTKVFSIEENPAKNASGGAGVQAAQWVANKNPSALISGNLGPKAHDVLAAANISVYKYDSGNIADTLKAFTNKELTSLLEPNVDAHSGMNQ